MTKAIVAAGVLIIVTLLSEAAGKAMPEPNEAARFDQAQAIATLRTRIAGHENDPAQEVFRNIRVMKKVPAERLLAIMEMGYSRSLGVNCTHCHVPGEWEKDEKTPKQIAREMMAMSRAINEKYLAKIKGLRSETPIVNCTTCHRGQLKPALDLPSTSPKS